MSCCDQNSSSGRYSNQDSLPLHGQDVATISIITHLNQAMATVESSQASELQSMNPTTLLCTSIATFLLKILWNLQQTPLFDIFWLQEQPVQQLITKSSITFKHIIDIRQMSPQKRKTVNKSTFSQHSRRIGASIQSLLCSEHTTQR